MFELKKFSSPPVFFTDRKKVSDFEKVIKILPKNSAIIILEYDLDKKNREIFAQKIAKLAQAQGLKIIVGKDFDLAKKINADGIHFSDFDKLPIAFLKKKSFPKNFIFSFSCHSTKSFLLSKKIKPNLSFLTPIFSTTSHQNSSCLGLKALAKITFQKQKPNYFSQRIYALGGVDLQNIKALRKLKISGIGAIDLFTKNYE